jgi:hypothetical protein
VLKSCKWAKESLFKQALSFANVMADEARITVFELLSFRSLQVQFSKTPGSKYRSVKVKFHKVWDLTKFKSVETVHRRFTIVTSLSSVMKRLFDMIHASYEDRIHAGDTRRQSSPPFKLDLEHFVEYVNKLLLLLILSLVLVDHVFELTEDKEDRTDALISFCDELFSKVTTQTSFWKLLDAMLRVHHGRDETCLKYCRTLPAQAQDEFLSKGVEYPPEEYRDWLCSKIQGCTAKKKMYITEGRILQTETYGFIPFAFCSTSITLSTVDSHPIFILLYCF